MSSSSGKTEKATSNPAEEAALLSRISTTAIAATQKTPVMIADEQLVIQYVNEAAYTMFESVAEDIRKELPHFNPRDVVGKNIDIFHKNPAHQRSMLKHLESRYDGGFKIGSKTLVFAASPLKDKSDNRVGFAVEWQDATEEVEAKAQRDYVDSQFDTFLEQVVKMGVDHEKGEIDSLVDFEALEMPKIREAANLVNKMVNDHIETTKKVLAAVVAFGEGDLDFQLEQFAGQRVFLNEGIELIRSRLMEVVNEIRMLSDHIVSGNLQVEIDLDRFQGVFRSIVESFDKAYFSLNSAFSVISEQVGQVAETVDQMSNASQSLSSNSQIASSSVDEVSASAEETDQQVKANAEATQRAAKSVQVTSEYATIGAEKVKEMVVSMDGIKTSSQDIAKIIKVIDEIAFQTNLLALNAAVEAARAGQHGRGFAVVAQEVRNLAGRSAKAARETSDLIEDASNRVASGVRITDETSEAFSKITAEIARVREIVEEIDNSSDEQARGVAQISQAIAEVSKTALATSEQADELAATSAQMNAASQQIREELNRFKLRKANNHGAKAIQMDQLTPEMMSHLQKMLSNGAMNAGSKSNGVANGAVDQDVRGYGTF